MPTATRQLPPDPRTIAEMIPVRQAELAARETPACPIDGHGLMAARPLDRQTYEQMWCGVWYDCDHPRCSASVSWPSRELAAYHGEPYNTGTGWEQWTGTSWEPITDAQAEAHWAARVADRERRDAEMRAAARTTLAD